MNGTGNSKYSSTLRMIAWSLLLALLAGGTGCVTTPPDPGQITASELAQMGSNFGNSLMESDRFAATLTHHRAHTPPLVIVSRFKNLSQQQIETSLLTQRICAALNHAGTMNAQATDKAALDYNDLREFILDRYKVDPPDFVLFGNVSQAPAGDGRHLVYTFSLSFVDVKTEEVIWTGKQQLVKGRIAVW